ncbi:UNVERIFIED_CONTAM: WD repeat-containing protein VIP3 [Sesamum calycinum]|uniref:WD repeat-containing protein VIP3 n=1 Tax=Sesamum calycinum TaxID=2727403 RepID=A0AAW2N0J4_9LAMI
MKLAPLNTVQNAHDDSVWTAAWVPATEDSPPLLLTGSLETVRLWNPEGPEKVQTNTGHCLGVVSVAAHPSGRIAASASIDSFIRVFDVATNNTIATLEAPPSEVWQLQFNPQGTTLAAAGGGSASVKLWDTAEWKLVAALEVPRPEGLKPSEKSGSKKFALSVAWSPDGHCMPVRSLVYSSAPLDSRVLFSASDDGHVHVYDAERKTLITSMSGHSSWVLSVDVSPDGAAIATGSSDKTVRLWDLKMRAATQILTSHNDQVWAVAFGPPLRTDVRSCLLASVSDDKSVSFYKYS